MIEGTKGVRPDEGGEVMYDYGGCHVCGERMEEKRIKQDFWIMIS